MRTPSTFHDLYAWHRAHMMGDNPPRYENEPHCGWYRTRLVKGGPWVPVEIRCQRVIDPETGELACDERLIAIMEGKVRDPLKVWTYLTPISRHEFAALQEARKTNSKMQATMARIDLTEGAVRP